MADRKLAGRKKTKRAPGEVDLPEGTELQDEAGLLQDFLAVATGKRPVDLVLRNARLVNVLAGEIHPADIAISYGRIVGFGDYRGVEEIDLGGRYVCPGLIDAHVHIESSMVSPAEFARAVVPHGTTTVVVDPHEIANVCGVSGIEYMLAASEELPLSVYVMLPSCVPATPLENAGALLGVEELRPFWSHPRVLGLGELMDYPAVLNGHGPMLEKLLLGRTKRVDGHGPGLSGKALCAYIAAGVGSEHECTTADEARERLRLGMRVMLREGSAARNLKDLLPVVTSANSRRCMFATDDRHPEDLLAQGHIDHLVRTAIEEGLDPITAIQMATINAAEYFGLAGSTGAIAPGYWADLVVVGDLREFRVERVFWRGKLVARHGGLLVEVEPYRDAKVKDTIHTQPLTLEKLRIQALGSKGKVLELVPHQIVTKKLIQDLPVEDGSYVARPDAGLLKLVVAERHRATGNVGVAMVKGFGLQKGAIASTVAHDSHNIVAIGAGDEDILAATAEVVRLGGGLAVVEDGRVLGSLALPIAGLMSEEPLAVVRDKLGRLHELARGLGVRPEFDPFMTLAFLSLPVIPELKLTDLGLVDVESFTIVPVSEAV